MTPERVSYFTTIWPELCAALTNKYNVLGAYNLLNYDSDMAVLAAELMPFAGRSFADNERIVFSLYDTDYFYRNNPVGFTVTNLLIILERLDITANFCLLVTNYHGLGKHIPIPTIENNYSIKLAKNIVNGSFVPESAEHIKYHFAFLSNIPRDHRMYVKCYLEANRLTDRVLESWNPEPSIKPQEYYHPVDYNLVDQARNACGYFITTQPFHRTNQKIHPDKLLSDLYDQAQATLTQRVKNTLIGLDANIDNFAASFLKHSFMNLVAETVFDYPYPYITEKTLKCFWQGRPFVVIGAANSLKYLDNQGFKTFNTWFDESYDRIADPRLRLQAIFKIIDQISNWSLDECRRVYNDMIPILEYNYKHYCNNFCGSTLENLKQSL